MLNGLRPLGLLGAWIVAYGCADNGDDSGGQETTGGGSDQLTWCDVEPILETYCQRCHTEPPQNAAPFPLLTYEDTQEDGRYELMGSAVERDYMPPAEWLIVDPPVEPLPCSEKQTLLEWVDQGAAPPPGDDPGCVVTDPILLPCQ